MRKWVKDNEHSPAWSRKDFESHFEGSRGLFNYCWRKFKQSGEQTTAAEDVMMFLNDVA